MIVYSRVGFRDNEEYPASVVEILKPFYLAARQYVVNEGMNLYRVPWNSEAYEYVRQIKSILQEGEFFEYVETIFTEDEYANAAAYRLAFGSFIYTYGDTIPSEDYDPCCVGGSVFKKQSRFFLVPKSSFKNKEFGILSSLKYAVSETVRDEIIGLGATTDDFLPVITKKGEIVCWQIEPVHIICGLPEINGWRKVSGCRKCNFPIYWETEGEAKNITKKLLDGLKPLNKTEELFGDVNVSMYIINKDLYIYLHDKYPRMGFEPIFLADDN